MAAKMPDLLAGSGLRRDIDPVALPGAARARYDPSPWRSRSSGHPFLSMRYGARRRSSSETSSRRWSRCSRVLGRTSGAARAAGAGIVRERVASARPLRGDTDRSARLGATPLGGDRSGRPRGKLVRGPCCADDLGLRDGAIGVEPVPVAELAAPRCTRSVHASEPLGTPIRSRIAALSETLVAQPDARPGAAECRPGQAFVEAR